MTNYLDEKYPQPITMQRWLSNGDPYVTYKSVDNFINIHKVAGIWLFK